MIHFQRRFSPCFPVPNHRFHTILCIGPWGHHFTRQIRSINDIQYHITRVLWYAMIIKGPQSNQGEDFLSFKGCLSFKVAIPYNWACLSQPIRGEFERMCIATDARLHSIQLKGLKFWHTKLSACLGTEAPLQCTAGVQWPVAGAVRSLVILIN